MSSRYPPYRLSAERGLASPSAVGRREAEKPSPLPRAPINRGYPNRLGLFGVETLGVHVLTTYQPDYQRIYQTTNCRGLSWMPPG